VGQSATTTSDENNKKAPGRSTTANRAALLGFACGAYGFSYAERPAPFSPPGQMIHGRD